jgi:hypothetical protein
LVRDVAPQNLEEGVDWIVVHDDCLTGFMRVMPDVREISGTGYDLTVHQPQKHFAPTTLVGPLAVTAGLFSSKEDARKRWSGSPVWFCAHREAARSGA